MPTTIDFLSFRLSIAERLILVGPIINIGGDSFLVRSSSKPTLDFTDEVFIHLAVSVTRLAVEDTSSASESTFDCDIFLMADVPSTAQGTSASPSS